MCFVSAQSIWTLNIHAAQARCFISKQVVALIHTRVRVQNQPDSPLIKFSVLPIPFSCAEKFSWKTEFKPFPPKESRPADGPLSSQFTSDDNGRKCSLQPQYGVSHDRCPPCYTQCQQRDLGAILFIDNPEPFPWKLIKIDIISRSRRPSWWDTLQHTATHCNTPQHTQDVRLGWAHCNTLQHTATQWKCPFSVSLASTHYKKVFFYYEKTSSTDKPLAESMWASLHWR